MQILIQKLCASLNVIYQKRVIHRDMNINNVMLHVPALEPTEDDLDEPAKFTAKANSMKQ